MRRRGFTLIEVLLATVLFAGLMSMYYEVFSNVVQLEDYARKQHSFASVGPAVMDLIEDDLLSLYAHPRARDAFPFRGEDASQASEPADRMAFVTRRASIHREEFWGRDSWVRSPVNETGYRLGRGLPGSYTRRLFRRETFYVDSSPLDGGDYFEVYDRVVSLDFKYVGYPVEETERSSAESLGEHKLEVFESWDSEERKGLPTAVLVTLTIEPPRLHFVERERRRDETALANRRTFVRVLHLVQADDVLPPPPAQGGPGQPAPGAPRVPAQPRPGAPRSGG